MKRFVKSERCKVLIMMLIPVVYCVVYCMIQGKSIFDVYLPASEWNDELFYYKQVESILSHGIPQGYFGFNESHALKLSFAAWSPVLVAPWVLWGAVFGWGYLSPIFCNIALMTIAMAVYSLLVKPTWKQIGCICVVFFSFTPFVRYMLSGMPEIICFSFLIIFYANAIRYLREECLKNLLWMFVLAGLLTLMRPYLFLFMLLPIFWSFKGWGYKAGALACVYSGVILFVYGLIKHYLGAEYFAPLYFTDWIKVYFEQGLIEGILYTLKLLYWNGKSFFVMLTQGVREGLAAGSFFAGYILVMLLLCVQIVLDGKDILREKRTEDENANREKKRFLLLETHLLFSFVGMLAALLLMYKLTEGSKHLLTFIAASLFVISIMETRRFIKIIAVSVSFVYLYVIMALDPYDYQVPFVNDELVAQTDMWKEVFETQIEVNVDDAPSYENTVIWVFNDSVSVSKDQYVSKNLKWQVLYELPSGMGISCCMPDYLMQNFKELKSAFLVTVADGDLDRCCQEEGYIELARDDDIVFYRRY